MYRRYKTVLTPITIFTAHSSSSLFTDGTIQWRQHSEFQDKVIMSDYNPGTGLLKPLSYVHLTCTTADNDETLFIEVHMSNIQHKLSVLVFQILSY